MSPIDALGSNITFSVLSIVIRVVLLAFFLQDVLKGTPFNMGLLPPRIGFTIPHTTFECQQSSLGEVNRCSIGFFTEGTRDGR